MKLPRRTNRGKSAQAGFSLIEVLIAIVVMTIGLVAVLASITTAITATESAQEDLIARHKALDVMESIYTARNSQQIPFSQIDNISNGGIFVSGAQSLTCAGADGILGTADDGACLTKGATGANCPSNIDCMVLPGPDGVLGTSDDVTMSLSNFTRTIAFTPVQLPGGAGTNNNMKAVAVTVTYTKAGWPSRSYTVNGLITQYR